MKLSLAFGLAAMICGIMSGALWWVASLFNPVAKWGPRKMPGNEGVTSITLPNGEVGTWINGEPQFIASDLTQFFQITSKLNKQAAFASGLTSALGGIASALSAANF